MRAVNNLQNIDSLQADAVLARIELDLRIGAAFTRFQTLRFQRRFPELVDKLLSYGSCQFPTLGFVVEQYLKRERFIPEPFWSIAVVLRKDDMDTAFTWDRGSLFDRLACFVLYDLCRSNPMATVTSVTSKETKKYRPLPLTTVEMQKFCSRYFKISASTIMKVRISEKSFEPTNYIFIGC